MPPEYHYLALKPTNQLLKTNENFYPTTYGPAQAAPLPGTPEETATQMNPSTVRVPVNWDAYLAQIKNQLAPRDTPPSGSDMYGGSLTAVKNPKTGADVLLRQQGGALTTPYAQVDAVTPNPVISGLGNLLTGADMPVGRKGPLGELYNWATTPSKQSGSPLDELLNSLNAIGPAEQIGGAALGAVGVGKAARGRSFAAGVGKFLTSEEGAQFESAIAKAKAPAMGNLGAALEKATANQQKRMVNIVQDIQAGKTIDAAKAEELRNFLQTADPANAGEYDRILTPVVLAQRATTAAEKNAAVNARFVGRVEANTDRVLGNELRATERDIAEAQARLGKTTPQLAEAQARTDAAQADIAARQAAAEGKNQGRFAAKAAQIDERVARAQAEVGIPPTARVGGTSTTRVVGSISKEDALLNSKAGAISAADAELLSRSGINVAYHDAEEAKQLATTIRQNPGLFGPHQTVSLSDTVYDAARYMGMTAEQMSAELARRGMQKGEASAFLVATNATIKRLGQETRALAADLVEGKGTQKIVDDAYARYISFVSKVGGADSEAGRMLNALKVPRTGTLVGAFQQNRVVTANRRQVADLTKLLEKQTAVASQLQKEAVVAKAAVASAANENLAKIATEYAARKEAEAVRAATALGKIQAKIDTTNATLGKAIARRAELGDEVRIRALKKVLRGGTDPEAVKALALLDPGDTVKIAETMRNLHKLSNGEKVIAWMSNNLYSGIQSLEANAIGGALRVVDKLVMTGIAEKTTAPLIARVTGEAVSIEKGATQAMAMGAIHAAPGAAHAMLDTMLMGLDETGARLADVRKGRPFPGKKGLFFEWALRTNGAADSAARHLANHMEGDALALHEAMGELRAGLITKAELGERTAFWRSNPTEQMLQTQGERAVQVSYGGGLGPFGEKVQAVVGHMFDIPGLGPTPALRMLFAASRFTWAATAFSVEYSGGGLIRMVKLASKGPAFHADAAIAGARGAVGGLLLAGGFGLYSQGLLMGKDPEGRGRDDSVLINGQWVPLKWAWPLTGGLIYAARIGDAEKSGRLQGDAQIWNYVQYGAAGMADAITSHPVVRTTAGLYDAIRKGGETGEKFFANLLASRVVPEASALRDIVRMVDNVERDPKGFWEYLKLNTPLSSDIKPKIDPYTGKPLQRAVQGVERLNPVADPQREATTPVAAEYSRHQKEDPKFTPLGLPSEKLTASGKAITLDQNQLGRYSSFLGQARNEVLTSIISSDEYQHATGARQRELLNQGETKASNAARKALGIEMATTSTDPLKVTDGVLIAMSGGNTLERAGVLDHLNGKGVLTPEVTTQLDRSRGPISPASEPRIIDGDTVELTVDGKRVKVRLVGTNAPETDKGGALDAFLAGKTIEIMSIKTDRFGRTVAEVYADGQSASDHLESIGRAKRTYYEQDSADLKVSELLAGKKLREAYDAAPPYRPARMAQLQEKGVAPDVVAAAADNYKKLIKQAQDKGVKSPWNTDPQLKKFYATEAGGMLNDLYSIDGNPKENEKSDERNAIEKDPLWPKFKG